MRLFEFAPVSDTGAIMPILAILRDLGTKQGSRGEVSYDQFLKMIEPLDLPLGDPETTDPERIITAIKNAIDPTGDVIKDYNPETKSIVLNQPNQPAPKPDGSTTVDKMASRAAQKAISAK